MPPFSIVDIVALAVIAFTTVQGYFRRLSGELARLIGVILAFFLALRFYVPIGDWVRTATRLDEGLTQAAAFTLTLLAGIAALIVIRLLLRNLIKLIVEERADKAGGVLAGCSRGCIVVAALFLILNLWPHAYLNRTFGEESVLGSLLLRAMPTLRDTVENVTDTTMPPTPDSADDPEEDR